MRLVYAERNSNRQASFEFLNRQMVWHAFTVRSFFQSSTNRETRYTRQFCGRNYLNPEFWKTLLSIGIFDVLDATDQRIQVKEKR